jgi:SAM-dependent methyltransferase
MSPNPYDSVAYPSAALPQTHPDRLATQATLFGLSPASVARCRVLDIGCGDGNHLIACAASLPASSFVGVDLAAAPIERGQAAARELGLANIDLRAADLTRLTAADGPFDYIVAHGVYSWVPAEVRDRLLAVCADLLAPQGVAFVSYNTYPGCHVRRMAREIMRFHIRHLDEPTGRVEQATALLHFLRQGCPAGEDESAFALRKEVEKLLEHGDPAAFYHDDLADVNEPVYFHEFAAHAARHGLQYLADADLFEMQDRIYPETVARTLADLGRTDFLLKEQYLDFLKARRFRQTLLCRADVAVDRAPRPESVGRFALASKARPISPTPDLGPGVVEEFRAPRGGAMRVDLPVAKAAMVHLSEAWPLRLPFADLVIAAADRLGGAEGEPDHTAALAEALLAAAQAGLVELHVHVPVMTRTAGDRPVAFAVARRQLRDGDRATTLLHTTVVVEDLLSRRLIQLLDGTRDRAALLAALAQEVEKTSRPADERAAFLDQLGRELEQNLQRAAMLGLLVE